MRPAAAILTLVSLANLTYATPARRGSGESENIETSLDLDARSDGFSHVSSAIKNRDTTFTHYDDGGNTDGDEISLNHFAVPGTKTTITLFLGVIGNATAQRIVLNATNNFIHAQLAASGDGQLPQAVDPFYYDLNEGSFFQCQSSKGQHLTWGILGAVVGWLYKHLGESAQYRHEATITVYDSQWGMVGTGMVAMGYSGVAAPPIVAGPAGVTNYHR